MDSPVEDKEWASKYLLDPLNEPEPSEVTGPGSHFVRPQSPKVPSTVTTQRASPGRAYLTPPQSASPTQSSFHRSNPYSPSYRQTAFGEGNGKGRQRASSLGERFPGDMSHRPLAQIRKDTKTAHRAPHLRKKHFPGTDVVDSLDSTFGTPYHHDGPYDATLLARNTGIKNPPMDAVHGSNQEALRATAREHIRDALDKHVPLQGTAVIPPGMRGLDGRMMEYEEGADLMREADAPGGAYKRWVDVDYLPDDFKGKGEPSYSIEKALKDHKYSTRRSNMPDGNNDYEMQTPRYRPDASRQRSNSQIGESSSDIRRQVGNNGAHNDFEGGLRRSNTTGNKLSAGLKRRFGSLRRHKDKPVDA